MTITKAEYDRLMQGRTRPLTDEPMSNAKATKWRAEEAASAIGDDDTVDRLVAVIEERQRRQTASNVVPIASVKRKGPPLPTRDDEVEQEVAAAVTRMDTFAYRNNPNKPNNPKDAA